MNEWGVFGVIAALIAFVASVIAPIIKLTTAITKLTVTVEGLQKQVEKFDGTNEEDHRELRKKDEEQDCKLEAHGNRITALENSGRAGDS